MSIETKFSGFYILTQSVKEVTEKSTLSCLQSAHFKRLKYFLLLRLTIIEASGMLVEIPLS